MYNDGALLKRLWYLGLAQLLLLIPSFSLVCVRGLVLYPGNLAKFYWDKNGILGGQRKHSTYIYVCRWLLTGGTFIPESLVAAVLTV